jgi:hypothetical protein
LLKVVVGRSLRYAGADCVLQDSGQHLTTAFNAGPKHELQIVPEGNKPIELSLIFRSITIGTGSPDGLMFPNPECTVILVLTNKSQ